MITFPDLLITIELYTKALSTHDIIEGLFVTYLAEKNRFCSVAQASLWSRGERAIPGPIVKFYMKPGHDAYLEDAIRRTILIQVLDKTAFYAAIERYLLMYAGDSAEEAALVESLYEKLPLEKLLAKIFLYCIQQRQVRREIKPPVDPRGAILCPDGAIFCEKGVYDHPTWRPRKACENQG